VRDIVYKTYLEQVLLITQRLLLFVPQFRQRVVEPIIICELQQFEDMKIDRLGIKNSTVANLVFPLRYSFTNSFQDGLEFLRWPHNPAFNQLQFRGNQ